MKRICLFLLLSFFLFDCKRGIQIYRLPNRKMNLFAAVPSESIAFQYDSVLTNQQLRYYFDKNEWAKCIEKACGNKRKEKIYYEDLDSAKHVNGVILTAWIRTYPRDTTRISAAAATNELMDSLIFIGHVAIKRNDESVITKVYIHHYVSRCGSMWELFDVKTNEAIYDINKDRYSKRGCGGEF